MSDVACTFDPGHIPVSRLHRTWLAEEEFIHRACRQTCSAGVCVLSPSPSDPLRERETPMTSKMSEKSYQAVRCLYCSEPIRLSPRLVELCCADSELQSHCQVFILRCDACSKEGRYLMAEIETHESESSDIRDLNQFGPRRSPVSYRKAAGL